MFNALYLKKCTCSFFIWGRKNSSCNVASVSGLNEGDRFISWQRVEQLPVGLDPMFKAVNLPAVLANQGPSISNVDGDILRLTIRKTTRFGDAVSLLQGDSVPSTKTNRKSQKCFTFEVHCNGQFKSKVNQMTSKWDDRVTWGVHRMFLLEKRGWVDLMGFNLSFYFILFK